MLNHKVETLDNLPEAIAAEYSQVEDGTYVLNTDHKDLTEDVTKLKGSLTAERTAHKDTKAKFSWVGELNAEEVQKLRDEHEDLSYRLENSDAPTEEQLEERAEKIAERKMRGPMAELETLRADNQNHVNAIGLHEAAGAQRTIRDAVSATLKGKDSLAIVDGASEDILPFAERIMTINDEGQVVTRDNVGFEPGLPFVEVLSDLQSSGRRSHWFKVSTSANAGGGTGKPNTGVNPFKTETFSLAEISVLRKADPARAIALCKAAGENPAKFALAG